MRKFTATLTITFLIYASNLFAQQKVRISGFVKDQLSGELLIGANIIEPGTRNGTVSDYNGYFSIVIKIPSSLQISYIGYKNYFMNFNHTGDTLINVLLTPGNELDEVVIKAQRTPKFNVATLSNKELQQIPSIGGKPDVSKSIQLLPGIYSQNEGSSLLLVRGGDPGQNLYLFDNVPVIYVNHLGGFASVFNSDIINNIDVYKGGFPSRYGGKLSSVVDIVQKEGDTSGLKGSFGIGITDASFTVEGPLRMKNTSFIITGRKTMTDPLMALVSKLSEANDFIISYGFHDINGKFSWKPNEKNSYNLNFYQGDDYLNYWSDTKNNNSYEKHRMGNVWGNWLVSARWNTVLSSRLFISNSISYTRYRLKEYMKYSVSDGTDTAHFKKKYLSSVQDLSFRSGWKYKVLKEWAIEFGLQSSLLLHMPNYTYLSNQAEQQPTKLIKSLESAIYFDNKITLLSNSEAILGMRIVNYSTQDYTDFSIEPRVKLNIAINSNQTLNLSYMKVTQYSHLIFTTGNIMNNEVWIPANKQIPAAFSDQYTLGWNGSFVNNMFTAEMNVYYKKMFSLSTYKEGYTSLMGDENWRLKIETGGKGNAMGAEFLIRKNFGKWTGFTDYSISNATRQFPNINKGKEYLFDYDRLHTISMSASYKLNEKLSFNLTWIYQTGLPYTPAIGRQYVPSLKQDENGDFFYYEALIYSERNSERMKDYHRLDLGLSYSTLTKKTKRKAIWSFSIYNVYNRRNPYYYYFNTNNSGEIYKPELGDEFKPVSLYQVNFFPIIPSISYKLFFNENSNKNKGQKISIKQKFKNWLYHEN
ncbi:MAG: carboxypeptidase-like regulatory domain-containing protein [Bacteroidales bacterium]|nr:carboxypeptidase-like regulatory domain-containing protein [Bacteroidales bacterium]